jgi:hypothetical protein
MTPVGFETTISAGERPQTFVLERAATGIGTIFATAPFRVSISLKLMKTLINQSELRNEKSFFIFKATITTYAEKSRRRSLETQDSYRTQKYFRD